MMMRDSTNERRVIPVNVEQESYLLLHTMHRDGDGARGVPALENLC